MQGMVKRILSVLLLLLILPLWRFELTAEEPPRVVRVGYYLYNDFQEKDEDGNYSGFNYDYLMQIQKYTHWQYEFVDVSYGDCIAMLERGELDLACGIVKTEQREQTMGFSRYSMASSQSELYANRDNDTLYYESFDTLDGCSVAVLAGTLTTELDEYCSYYGFSLTKMEFTNVAEMNQALTEGTVDLVYTSSMSDTVPAKVVARFDKVPLYYAVNKQAEGMLRELNDALRKIMDINPDFYNSLSEKYMLSGINAAATFTKEELDYINSGQEIYVILNADWEPISWWDEKQECFRGIAIDVIEELKEYSHLEFVYCTQAEFEEKLAENPDIDNHVIAILADDNTWALQQSVFMSNHIVDSRVVAVSKRGVYLETALENTDFRIALPNNFYISWCIERVISPDQITCYDTVEDCLDAINQGKADITFVNEYVATYFLSLVEYTNLFATANSGYFENLAFAVNKDSGTPLLGIIDKCMICIGKEELGRIVLQNSIAHESLTLKGLYYANPLQVSLILGGIVILTVTAVLVIIYMMQRRRILSRELEKETNMNQAQKEFFTIISHELRTPLNAVIGYLGLAKENQRKPESVVDFVKKSWSAAKQLSSIADDMLDYTKILDESITLKEEIFSIEEIVNDVAVIAGEEALKKNITFEVRADQVQQQYVSGDCLRVREILLNLLSNAIKFTQPLGTVELRIWKEELSEELLQLHICVTDNGKGMSEEFLQKICAPFNQGDAAFSRKYGGMGLGLYLTRTFIDMMQGSWQVRSEEGKGSSFEVGLPLRAVSGQDTLKQEINYSSLRTMLAIPDAENADMLRSILKQLKIKCEKAENIEKLEKRLLSRQGTEYVYRLCILDESLLIQEPGLAERLKHTFEQHGELKMFLLSSERFNQDETSSYAGIDQVISKPLFSSVVFNLMIDYFGKYQSNEESLEEEKPNLDGAGVLVVEDNATNADILSRMLLRIGAKVTCVENGQEAVDEFLASKPEQYRFIFMDIQMPVMNGYEAARCIRASAHPEAKTVPIIAVSANAFPEDVEQSYEAGMNEHVSKPVSGKKLYDVIRKEV